MTAVGREEQPHRVDGRRARARDRRTGNAGIGRAQGSPALLLLWSCCALGALPLVVVAQPWSPLVRESRPSVVEEVFLEAHFIREVDPGVFEVRLMYEPVGRACLRRDVACRRKLDARWPPH